jgi:hypothetical protein
MDFYHSVKSVSTGYAPNDAGDDDTQNYIRAIEFGKGMEARRKVNQFRVGQRVRVLQDYDVFRQHRVKAHFSPDVFVIAERTGYSFKLKNAAGEWVMAVSEEGDPQTYVRLWRAWELLRVGESSVPPAKTQSTQEVPIREQKKANITNRERRKLDVPVLENPADLPPHPQPVTNVGERAIEREALPERQRKKSERQAELEEQEQAKPAPKPKKQPLVLPNEWFVDKVLDHRIKKGQLQFRVQWAGVPTDYYKNAWFFPLDPTFRTGNLLDKKVGDYMAAHNLHA